MESKSAMTKSEMERLPRSYFEPPDDWPFGLINVDKRQHLWRPPMTSFQEYVDKDAQNQMLSCITWPDIQTFRVSEDAIMTSKLKSNQSPLIALQFDVIERIIVKLPDIDLICLFLTNSFFLRFLGPRVQDLLVNESSSWAGDRFIFLDRKETTLPKNLGIDGQDLLEPKMESLLENPLWVAEEWAGALFDYQKKYMPVLASRSKEKSSKESGARGKLFYICFAPLIILRGCISFVCDDKELEQNLPRQYYTSCRKLLLERVYGRLRRRNESEYEAYRLLLLLAERTIKKHRQTPAILRNHTAKQYIRDDILVQSKYFYSLADTLLVNAQWTTESIGSLDRHGSWAGHSFDIARLADVRVKDQAWVDLNNRAYSRLIDPDVGSTEWTDVTEQAIGSLRNAGLLTPDKKLGPIALGVLSLCKRITDTWPEDIYRPRHCLREIAKAKMMKKTRGMKKSFRGWLKKREDSLNEKANAEVEKLEDSD